MKKISKIKKGNDKSYASYLRSKNFRFFGRKIKVENQFFFISNNEFFFYPEKIFYNLFLIQ